MSYYTRTEPQAEERALGDAVAAFVAEAFGLSGLRLVWVSPGSEAVAAIDVVLERLTRLTEGVVETRGFSVDGDIAGLARPALAGEEPPAIVVRVGLPASALIETIAHEAAHVLQFRQHGETLNAETLATWEQWAERLAKATASAWVRTIGFDDPRFDLHMAWHQRWKQGGR